MTKQWHDMTALELGHHIGENHIRPTELAEYFFARIDNKDTEHEIYVRLTKDRAMKEAVAAENRAKTNQRRSPVDGVPISWKDLFDTAGIATEAGVEFLQGRIPEQDAPVLTRATRAGLVCLGKTNMPDLAFSGLGNNVWTGTGANPFDSKIKRVPGGSSSGAALSIAHGLAPAGIGSDTAGSVRIPAAWCGLVGLKTTHGLISLDGVVPLSPSQDTIGPLTKSVADANILTAIMAGQPAADLSNASLKGKRFLRASTIFDDLVEPDVATTLNLAIDKLKAAGAEIVDGPLPVLDDLYELCSGHVSPANMEGYALWKGRIEADPDKIYGPIARRFLAAASFDSGNASNVFLQLKSLQKEYLRYTAEFDGVIGATEPAPPPPLQPLMDDEDTYLKAALMSISLTRMANLLGLCALTLPAGLDSLGLPVGLMVMAPPFSEGSLLRHGSAMEAALSN
jgi:aspartyl-tRNA(Asn)/glutamyl-tRNA(Gln) amidotransferase subunit A